MQPFEKGCKFAKNEIPDKQITAIFDKWGYGCRGKTESTLYDTGILGVDAKKSGWAAAKFAVDGGKLRKSTMNDSSPPRVRPFARGID